VSFSWPVSFVCGTHLAVKTYTAIISQEIGRSSSYSVCTTYWLCLPPCQQLLRSVLYILGGNVADSTHWSGPLLLVRHRLWQSGPHLSSPVRLGRAHYRFHGFIHCPVIFRVSHLGTQRKVTLVSMSVHLSRESVVSASFPYFTSVPLSALLLTLWPRFIGVSLYVSSVPSHLHIGSLLCQTLVNHEEFPGGRVLNSTSLASVGP
jgi:hypothetical protein